MELWFRDISLNQKFVIVRKLAAMVGEKAEYEHLRPIAPYTPRKREARVAEITIIPGIPPEPLRAVVYVVDLPQARIPAAVASALSRGRTADPVSYFRKSFLPQTLDSDSYARHFKYLIWAEEHRSE